FANRGCSFTSNVRSGTGPQECSRDTMVAMHAPVRFDPNDASPPNVSSWPLTDIRRDATRVRFRG
ncbi:MAG: hypothetical protein WB772_13275, partial [Xanthobacteraceae bacterium]